ncbi:hypothetical protein BDF20DRAFT_885128 [Mycotypha africana]|uniref:uncharacterized protein n=1 Tax=Mycotypha africana TaxID=64632 RepID=UPI00230142A5|nr:uncharacterized protein BDF20DRAFT_885128 [Mycotypha africana]KAI8971564.1 hypothetical protein BDF20DRAFT_885128 [Mycotypha africana]
MKIRLYKPILTIALWLSQHFVSKVVGADCLSSGSSCDKESSGVGCCKQLYCSGSLNLCVPFKSLYSSENTQ